MTQLPKSKVRSVGVSNHTIEHVRDPPTDLSVIEEVD